VTPAVEIVIPHLSRWDLLRRLLVSLGEQTESAGICVVDNGSTDESVARLRERFPRIRLIAAPANLGFGRAVNLGVRSSNAESVIVLNNDMVADPNFVAAMRERLATPQAVSVSGTQLRPDGRIESIGVAIDSAMCAHDVGYGLRPDDSETDHLRPFGPSGGAAGFTRSAFLDAGGYDERIFAYLEDVDLAIRLWSRGVPHRVASDAIIWHRHSSTLGSGSAHKNRLMGWSRGYLLAKYAPALSARAVLRGVVNDAVLCAGQAVIDRNLGFVRGRLDAWRDRSSIEPLPYEGLPVSEIGLLQSLRRRLQRRL
jgi:N-acetylglucosaminyl-diphospho-decaprenol L-rhamnosyltransferase